jgi:hypothetical protein
MRENRLYGSEGGGAKSNWLFLPLLPGSSRKTLDECKERIHRGASFASFAFLAASINNLSSAIVNRPLLFHHTYFCLAGIHGPH